MSSLPFPLDISTHAPPGILSSLTSEELGAFLRLMALAWTSNPPCTLPNADSYLSQIAGVTPQVVESLLAKLGPAVRRDEQYRICFPALERKYQDASRRREQQREAGRSSGLARLSNARSTEDERSFSGRSTHVQVPARIEERVRAERSTPERSAPERSASERSASERSASERSASERSASERSASERSASERSASERSALQRSSLGNKFQRSLGALSAEIFAQFKSAGARALAEQWLTEWRSEKVHSMVSDALEHWREAGLITVPFEKAEQLAQSLHATPARVLAAIEAVEDKINAKECRSAFGLFASKLGATQRSAGRPMPIPRSAIERWDRLEVEALNEHLQTQSTAAQLESQNRSQPDDWDIPGSEDVQ